MDCVEYAFEINYPLRCKNCIYVYCLQDIIIFNGQNAAKSSFIKNEINKKHVNFMSRSDAFIVLFIQYYSFKKF